MRIKHSAKPVSALFAAILLASLGGAAPQIPNPRAFARDFHISYYLDLAAQLQKLEPEARTAGLRKIAADPAHAPELFPLCRMLFDAKDNGPFRRPVIGGPNFIDGGAPADWPLEPITLYEGIPILVATGYTIAGGAGEMPDGYLNYCLGNCKWRDTKFAHLEPAEIQKKVEAFLAATPKAAAAAEKVRAQAK